MPASNELLLLALLHPAHDLAPQDPAWSAWTFEPGVVVPLVAAAAAYAVGVRRLWRTPGGGRSISRRHVIAFTAGWLALVAALVSPVDAVSAELFSMHMVQHELLMLVAAPLLVVGAPLVALLWAIPASARRPTVAIVRKPAFTATWGLITAPAVIWLLHAVALWVWHAPSLYEAALANDAVHALEHACFFVTAALFWWGLTHGQHGRLGYGSAVIYVFATAMHSGLLGAALTLSPRPWYALHAPTSQAWGLTPLEDQQLAGLIMWVPAGLIFLMMGLIYFAAWVKESGRRVRYNTVVSAAAFLSVLLIQTACQRDVYREASAMTGGDPYRGRTAIARYGCDTCHTIPGVRTANGRVGPPLAGVAARVYLAGHIPNTPVNMQDWIRHPRQHDTQTVMPDTGVTEQDGRDIAAFLYTLR
jgi:putative membrane protein